jgi:hypothetical protein
MVRQALTAAVLALGMLVVPVLPLTCGGSDHADDAASACCREMADRCNRSSMKDDCCRTAPGSDDGAPSATKAERTPRVDPLKAFAPVVILSGHVVPAVFTASGLHGPAVVVAVDVSPSPPSVLRV